MHQRSTTPSQGEPLLLSIPEVARRLSCGQTLTWALVRDHKLPCVRISRRTLVPAQALAEFVASLTSTSGR